MNVYLIDGTSYAYRAFYAIRELSTSRGVPTNAIYGFINMLLKIIKDKKPDGIAIFFDSPVPTERHRIFEEYKAQRPETPRGLVEQMPSIRKLISALNIKVFEMPGYEADDSIGSVAKDLASKGIDVLIVTADKDMLQLIGNSIKIYDPVREGILDERYVRERFGVDPERIPEVMALMGDTIDNIPGVKGIGEKTAKELLSGFRNLEELLSNVNSIKKEKLKKLISENVDMVKLSQRLATINTSVPIDVDIEELKLKEPNWIMLLSLFGEFEFTSLMKLIPAKLYRGKAYEIVLSLEKLREVVTGIKSALDGEVAFTIQLSGNKSSFIEDIVGFACCIEKERGFYIPIAHSYPGVPMQLTKEDMLEVLSQVLSDESISKTGHNLKQEITILEREGICIQGSLFDTMIASYLINPNRPNHGLEEIALEYLSLRKKTFKEIIGKKSSFADIPLEEAAPFATENAVLSHELREILFSKLKDDELEKIYFEIEMPLIHVLSHMEKAGVKIDIEKLNYLSKELERELDGIQRRIYFLAGEEFNINSPKQLSKVLFQSLGFQPTKKTKTGYSTELSVLEELAESHELPREVLNYRSLGKMKTTYVDVLPRLVNPKTGRVHTSFNQAATATGRLSSSEPNLQNIPIRGEWGRRIRETFIAEKGNLLMSADYSQIELRILSQMSQDEGLLEAFKNDLDIHSRTASELFGIPIHKVTAEMRRVAKTVNFGVIYGISPFGLSETLSIPREDAKKYIEQYFNRHPGVKRYIEEALVTAKKKGYVTTLFGRRRPIPELKSHNANIRLQGERFAINSPIQGTAADIIKLAMIHIWKRFKEGGLKAKMVLQVHDELLFEFPAGELGIVTEIVRKEMEGVVKLSVPIKVEIGSGMNWAEAH